MEVGLVPILPWNGVELDPGYVGRAPHLVSWEVFFLVRSEGRLGWVESKTFVEVQANCTVEKLFACMGEAARG